MKIFKGKAFFFKSVIFHLFLVLIISFVSINFWENSIYDTIVNNVPSSLNSSDDVVLVMIDDKSTIKFHWPWKREMYGEILEFLGKYGGAKTISFDILIDSSDRDNPLSDEKFFKIVKGTQNFIPASLLDTHTYNEEIVNKNYDNIFLEKFKLNIDTNCYDILIFISKYKSLSIFPEQYFNSIDYTGLVNLRLSNTDGKLRDSFDLLNYKNSYLPSIALQTYLTANQTNIISIVKNNIIVNKTGLKIPVKIDYYGNLTHKIKFYKLKQNSNYSHKAYSAVDIIESNRLIKSGKTPIINPKEFEGKYVFIGANAINVDDSLNTPVSRKHPGPDIQATILDNYLQNDFMYPLTTWQNIAIILLMCIITFVLIRMLTFLQSLISILAIGIIYFVICVIAINNSVVPLVITPLAVQLSTMIFGYSYRFILEGRNKEKIQNAMGKYLSQDIMKNVVQNIDDIKLGGKKANVTVLFSDIRGFTSMSEKMTAEEVSMILNEYFSEMEPIVTKYNGVINKFIGDAVMAIFGEPVQDINHPQNAVKCAYEMLKKVEQLREKWLIEGKPKIEIGIGINTGEAFVGNIGSQNRLEYTVIGDTVNLASRIEGYNKVYKTNLLISSSTYAQVSDIVDVIKIADVTIRGKAKKMDIYEVLKLVLNK